MTRCSRCEAENLDEAKFCGVCGGRMEAAIEAPLQTLPSAASIPLMRGLTPVPPPRPEEHFAAMRGMTPVPIDGSAYAGPSQLRFARGKNPWRSLALCLFFPGGGQFYNGDIKKGFTLLVIALLSYGMMLLQAVWFVGALLSVGAWAWAIVDARKVALQQKAMW